MRLLRPVLFSYAFCKQEGGRGCGMCVCLKHREYIGVYVIPRSLFFMWSFLSVVEPWINESKTS